MSQHCLRVWHISKAWKALLIILKPTCIIGETQPKKGSLIKANIFKEDNVWIYNQKCHKAGISKQGSQLDSAHKL